MFPAQIPVDASRLKAFCEKFGVVRLLAYGSVLREDFDPDRSDIDLLVEFGPNTHRGLLKIAKMRRELSAMFCRDVDLTTPGSLGKYLQRTVLESAQVLYDAA